VASQSGADRRLGRQYVNGAFSARQPAGLPGCHSNLADPCELGSFSRILFEGPRRVRGDGACGQQPSTTSLHRKPASSLHLVLASPLRSTRISPRRVQFAFRTWQVKAGFDRLYPFHALRPTAVTNVYRASRDLLLAQRFARHVSLLTTTVYKHSSVQEMWERVRRLSC